MMTKEERRQNTSEAMKRFWERRRAEAQRLTQPSRVTPAQGTSARTTTMRYASTPEIIQFLNDYDQEKLAAMRAAPRGAGQMKVLREEIERTLRCKPLTQQRIRSAFDRFDNQSAPTQDKTLRLPRDLVEQARAYRENQNKLRDAILGQNGEEKKVPLLQQLAQIADRQTRIEQGLVSVMHALGIEE
jgi:hypothetical protein